jgi:hypothetical protein
MLNARIRISVESWISRKVSFLILNARIGISVESCIFCTVPDAECQYPDFGGESDLLYLMLNTRIRISMESRILMPNVRILIQMKRWIPCT